MNENNLPFKAFLSHRYKAPEINTFFFNLFKNEADIRFEVDVGSEEMNVTRLERLVRDADAFVGIYPYPGQDNTYPNRRELEKASRYFRLELDLAVRARKPSVAFIDKRYGTVLDPPPSILQARFDHQDILSARSPREQIYRRQIQQFRDAVIASMQYDAVRLSFERSLSNVGLLVPPSSEVDDAYSAEHTELITSLVNEFSVDLVRLHWPPILDSRFYSSIQNLDWLIVDLGERSLNTGIVSFLHGEYVPMIRLMHVKHALADSESTAKCSQLMSTLFGAYDVVYSRDPITWSDKDLLESRLGQRITGLYTPRRLIAKAADAEEYFQRAALRKESIFVSYSGEDKDVAEKLVQALRKRFQTVFDYKDKGESIKPGQSWLEEVFGQLSTSTIGIMLVSNSYFASGYCTQEAQEMISLRNSNNMHVVPIQVRKGEGDIPPWLKQTQLLRLWEYADCDAVVEFVAEKQDLPK